MKSIDTNVVIRLITKDDPAQTAVAAQVVRQPTFISHGVLMEAEWVLRSHYRWDRRQIEVALRGLLSIATVRSVDEELLFWCLDRYAEGAHLPDMLHIIAARETDAFVTFDQRLAKQAGADAPIEIVSL